MVEYHIMGNMLIVVSGGLVTDVVNGTRVYTIRNMRTGSLLKWGYVKIHKDIVYERILQDNCGSLLPVHAGYVEVRTARVNSRSYTQGWRMAGGIPCLVDVQGAVAMLYYDGQGVMLLRADGNLLPFEAWQYTVSRHGAEALIKPVYDRGKTVIVTPSVYRDRKEYSVRYDND